MDWYLYNSTDKDIEIASLKIKIKKRDTVNLRQAYPSVSDSFFINEIENGCLFDFVISKQIFVSNVDNRKKPAMKQFEVAKPFPRRSLATKVEKTEASRFIEELQSAFDGKILHQQPEDLISRNTAALLSQSSFDGTQDILGDGEDDPDEE